MKVRRFASTTMLYSIKTFPQALDFDAEAMSSYSHASAERQLDAYLGLCGYSMVGDTRRFQGLKVGMPCDHGCQHYEG